MGVGVVRRNAVPLTGLVGAAVTATVQLLREFGVNITPGQENALSAWIGVVFLLAGAVLAWLRATPTADPRDTTGTPLVPITAPPAPGTVPAASGRGGPVDSGVAQSGDVGPVIVREQPGDQERPGERG